MTSSRVSFESSPFHLVPCSPYIGTTISAISPAVRAVPEVAETADVFVTDSPRSVAGQDVPQTPVFHNGSGSSKQNERVILPHNTHRVATPEQEVPKTPMQSDSSATKKKPRLILKIKTKTNTPSPGRDDAKQINFFHGDDEDIFD